ncbi:MAG: EF-hand domain-containing protein [Byssovorax sp.]
MASSSDKEELTHKIKGLLLRKTGSSSRESMQTMFKSYDHDKNGRIGASELKDLLNDASVGNGFTRGAWVDGIIKELDTNHDGEISWEEFDASIR